MSNTRTLAQLRSSVQTRGGYENSDDITTAIINEYINEAISEAYDILVGKWADYYTTPSNNLSVFGTISGTGDSLAVASGVVTHTDAAAAFKPELVGQRITITGAATNNNGTFAITAVPSATTLQWLNPSATAETVALSYSIDGTQAVPLPSNFYKLRKVEILADTVNWRRLFPHDLDVSHRYINPVYSKGYRYRLQLGTVQLVPAPVATETIRIWYIPFAPRLVSDSDTFDGINGYEELVIQMAFRRCRAREEIDTSDIEREIDRLTARVRTAADSRDAGEPFYLDPYGPAQYEAEDEEPLP